MFTLHYCTCLSDLQWPCNKPQALEVWVLFVLARAKLIGSCARARRACPQPGHWHCWIQYRAQAPSCIPGSSDLGSICVVVGRSRSAPVARWDRVSVERRRGPKIGATNIVNSSWHWGRILLFRCSFLAAIIDCSLRLNGFADNAVLRMPIFDHRFLLPTNLSYVGHKNNNVA